MRQQGRLTQWNDDRGYGFITPLAGGARVFVHVSQFPRMQRRPMVTGLVTYAVSPDERGRMRAQDVKHLAPTRTRTQTRGRTSLGPVSAAAALPLAFFGLLGVLSLYSATARIALATSLVLSAATVIAYRSDKLAAQRGGWRTEESALHLMSLAGGWPGALIAQQLFRHKTQKQLFRAVFWFTVAGNLMVLAWLLANDLAGTLG